MRISLICNNYSSHPADKVVQGQAVFRAHALVSIDKADRYLAQLCKHFAHRIEVAGTDDRGHANFGRGRCDLEVGPGTLSLASPAALTHVRI